MAFISQHLMLSIIALPFLTAVLISSLGERNRNLREGATILIGVVTFVLVLVLTIRYLSDTLRVEKDILFFLMPGMEIAFRPEALGLLFALIASFLWPVATIYCIGYMRGNKEAHQTRFYFCFSLAIMAALGMAFSANLLTLFIFYEIMTLCTYPLVTHHGTEEAKRAGRLYLGMLWGSSILLLLPAILTILHLAGTLDFMPRGILDDKAGPYVTGILLAMVVYGVGKAALMPMHRWLPAAMVAPTPVSALLHAVAVVKGGVFMVVKLIVFIFGIDHLNQFIGEGYWLTGKWLVWLSGITVIAASFIALRQDELKKRLAYSTISQLSYVILAASTFNPIGIMAASFHIVAHAFAKITLFFAAGAIYTAAHKKKVSELDGIGRLMPFTMAAFTIGSLSMIGIPPTAGFISKWYMFNAGFAQEEMVVIGVLIASTILNAMYFLPIVCRAFFLPAPHTQTGERPHGEASYPIVLALIITASAVVILFFWPSIFLQLAKMVVN